MLAITYLIIAFLLNGAANIFLKVGAMSSGKIFPFRFPETLIENRYFFLGLVLFALNVFFYGASLKSLPLSVAYPVMVGASFLLVNGYASLWLNEKMTPMQMVGYVCIVAGILLVTIVKRS